MQMSVVTDGSSSWSMHGKRISARIRKSTSSLTRPVCTTRIFEWGSRADNEIAEYVKTLGLELDAKGLLGGWRSKRFAMVVNDGKVVSLKEEPDAPGVTVTAADKVLESL